MPLNVEGANMIYKLLKQFDSKQPFDQAKAHCDIPCKIYDPIKAQIAVLTMIRMIDLLDELNNKEPLLNEQQATFNRLVSEKEQHGKQLKDEITTIWGDYIKQPQLDAYPELHQLTHNIMLKASLVKQHINREAALELLALVNRFAEIFWQTKGVDSYYAACPYPPAEQVLYPDLKGAIMFGLKIWKITGQSMAPVMPSGSFVLAFHWLRLLPIKEGHQIIINHPEYGIIVKTVALVDKNGFIWSKGENNQSLPVEKLGPVSKSQLLGRVVQIFKPERNSKKLFS